MEKRLLWVSVDSVIFLVAVLFGVLLETRIFRPYHRGFFCDDNSIRYPYRGNTVNAILDGALCLLLPTALLLLGVFVVHKRRRQSQRYDAKAQDLIVTAPCCNLKIRNSVRIFLVQTFYFLYGYAITFLLTNVGKYTIGRLRPHFIDVCKPDYSQFNCTDYLGNALYIGDPSVCTGSSSMIEEARLSWPSGHSSITTYAAVFTIMYIEATDLNVYSKPLKVILELIVAILALLVCLSRFTDNFHHWSDILSGAVLGAAVAFYIVFRLLRYFRPFSRNEADSNETGSPDPTIRLNTGQP